MSLLASKFGLKRVGGQGDGEELALACGEQLVGSLSDAAVRVKAGGVAPMHANLWVQHDAVYVTDLGSSAGTLVNGQPVTEGMPTAIELGDEVCFGAASFKLAEITAPRTDEVDLPLVADDAPGVPPPAREWSESSGSLAELAFLDSTSDDRLRRYFNTFCRFSHDATSSSDRYELLDALLAATCEVVEAERYFVLLGDNAETMKVRASRFGKDLEPIEGFDNEPPSSEFIRRTLEAPRPVSTYDALEDERFSARDSVMLHDIRSAIGIRLAAAGQTLGVLYLDSQTTTGLFSTDDAELVHTLGNVASLKLLYLASRKALLDLLTKTKREVQQVREAAVSLAEQVDEHSERLDTWLGHESHPPEASPVITEMREACGELREMVSPFVKK